MAPGIRAVSRRQIVGGQVVLRSTRRAGSSTDDEIYVDNENGSHVLIHIAGVIGPPVPTE